ncbi:MAG: AAA family ATPase, partial [Alphaproteobacteria bacterium]|nr:AAA family ATPase [Alphaproteobacteria bacterium]
MTLSLRKMNISHFRCYDAARIDLTGGAHGNIVVLTGPNGAGKTNILEAVSLLVPGKGLRGADAPDIKNRNAGPEDLWAVAAEIETADGETVRVGTGLDRETQRRRVRIDGENVKSQNALGALFAAVWLTPQMDRLFLEGASARRKFLDRLVAAFAPEHTASLNRYEKAMRERLRILQDARSADPAWLEALEARMAAEGVAVAAARRTLAERLQGHAAILSAKAPLFPQPVLSLDGWTENEI